MALFPGMRTEFASWKEAEFAKLVSEGGLAPVMALLEEFTRKWDEQARAAEERQARLAEEEARRLAEEARNKVEKADQAFREQTAQREVVLSAMELRAWCWSEGLGDVGAVRARLMANIARKRKLEKDQNAELMSFMLAQEGTLDLAFHRHRLSEFARELRALEQENKKLVCAQQLEVL